MKFEFSSNFDLKNIPLFWKKIGELIDGGISDNEIEHIVTFANSIKDNSADVIQMSFSFQSETCTLAFAIKMDGISPTILMLSDSQPLINAITSKHNELCGELKV